MNINIEIWKIFEDKNLVTYAFGDMGLYKTRAKGKFVVIKGTGDIYLVERIDKRLTETNYNNLYRPGIQEAIKEFRAQNSYPDKKNIMEASAEKKAAPAGIKEKKDLQKWRNAVNPDAVKDKLNKVLVSFFSPAPDDFKKLIGSGFILVAAGRNALVMTSAGIFQKTGMSHPNSHQKSTAPHERQTLAKENLWSEAKRIRVVYQSENYGDACIIRGISMVPELDIALCALEFQKEYAGPNFSYKLGLDTRVPKIGDEVVAIGFSGLNPAGQSPESAARDQHFEMARKIEMRIGRVTDVFDHGSTQAKWPGFETTIPIDAGMRGGPVFPFNPANLTMNACAVISRDLSPDSSFNNFSVPGRSIMAMIWPSLSLPFAADPRIDPAENNLLGLIKKGKIKDAGEADKKITIIKKGNQGATVSRLIE